MEQNFGLFGTPIAPADILAPRLRTTEELASIAQSRRELLQHPLTEVPDEVPTAYVPSGKSEVRSFPVLLFSGVCGIGLGYLAALATFGLADLAVEFFVEVGGLFTILLIGAIAAHFLAPLLIPFFAGFSIVLAGKTAGCRNPALGERVGWLLSPIAVAAVVWIGQRLVETPPLYEAMLEGMIGSLWGAIIGIPTALMFQFAAAKSGWVFLSLLGLLALILTAGLADGAGAQPYCEESGQWLERRVVARYTFEQLPSAMFGLFLGNGAHLSQLQSALLDQKVDSDEPRLELTFHSAPGSQANLVELTAHYAVGKERVERRLFSEMMNRSQIETLAAALDLAANGDLGESAETQP